MEHPVTKRDKSERVGGGDRQNRARRSSPERFAASERTDLTDSRTPLHGDVAGMERLVTQLGWNVCRSGSPGSNDLKLGKL